jgi:predicted CXXCH cytochrome family protein
MLLAFGVGSPAFADNGPHTSTKNVMNEDRCAGCHRAHTATAAYLLTDEEGALCETCHGAGSGGSKLDVVNGIGYTDKARGTAAGALRGGGFSYALIGSGGTPTQAVIARNVTVTGVTGPMVPALAAAVGSSATTSQHNVGASGTAWGGGAIGTTGTSVSLECGSCHDPHGGANSGNATFRILKVNPGAGVMVAQLADATADGANITFTTSFANTLSTGQTVAIVGANPTGFNVSGVVTVLSTTQFTIASTTPATGSLVSGGIVTTTAGLAGNVTTAVADGANVVYTTAVANTLKVGQVVSISGDSITALNLANVTITAVSGNTFTVASTVAAASGTGGYVTQSNTVVQDVPAGGTYNYLTTNYWAQDDTNDASVKATDPNGRPLADRAVLTGATGAVTVTSLENNISRWCTTCHTRLLAGSGSYKTALVGGTTTDAMYTFRHRSDANYKTAGKMGESPNCLTCHVSHGSNAAMTGTNSSAVKYPGDTGLAGSSFLLRVDNRGTCQMCHNK